MKGLQRSKTDNGTSAYMNTKSDDEPTITLSYDEVHRHLLQGKEIILDANDLKRNIASQVIVFLLAELDRLWKEEEPHAIPVAYFFRGYSLSMDIFREILEVCKEKCIASDIDVIVSAADGEIIPLIVRGKKGNPLTQLQLSKDIWAETSKLSKQEMLKRLKNGTGEYIYEKRMLDTIVIEDEVHVHTETIVNSRNKSLIRIKTPSRGWKSDKKNAVTKISEAIVECCENDTENVMEEIEPE